MPVPSGIKVTVQKDKSPSVRLRAVIYRYWESRGSQGDSEAFYQKQVDGIIEQYKKLLDKS